MLMWISLPSWRCGRLTVCSPSVLEMIRLHSKCEAAGVMARYEPHVCNVGREFPADVLEDPSWVPKRQHRQTTRKLESGLRLRERRSWISRGQKNCRRPLMTRRLLATCSLKGDHKARKRAYPPERHKPGGRRKDRRFSIFHRGRSSVGNSGNHLVSHGAALHEARLFRKAQDKASESGNSVVKRTKKL